jgi:hypothetical protein
LKAVEMAWRRRANWELEGGTPARADRQIPPARGARVRSGQVILPCLCWEKPLATRPAPALRSARTPT